MRGSSGGFNQKLWTHSDHTGNRSGTQSRDEIKDLNEQNEINATLNIQLHCKIVLVTAVPGRA